MIRVNVIVRKRGRKKYFKNSEVYLKKKIKKLNKSSAFFNKKKLEVSFLLTGSKEILQYNKNFLKKNKSTDVISFPFHEKKNLQVQLKSKSYCYLGDIVINLDKVVDESKNKKISDVFDKLWIHGLLHLLGGRHKRNDDYIKMKKLEKKYLELIN